jgi:hypothetical protein
MAKHFLITCQLICYRHHNQINMNQTRMRMEQKFSDFYVSRENEIHKHILRNENGFFYKSRNGTAFSDQRDVETEFLFLTNADFLFNVSFA